MASMHSPGLRARQAHNRLLKIEQRSYMDEEEGAAFFGSFCLACGESCTGDSAYCSDACEGLDASDAASHSCTYSPAWSASSVPPLVSSQSFMYDFRRSGQSSAQSSSPASSVTHSPSLFNLANRRLAMLAQGPLGSPIEEPTHLVLGENIIPDNVFRNFGLGNEDIPDRVSGATITDPNPPWCDELRETRVKVSPKSASVSGVAFWSPLEQERDAPIPRARTSGSVTIQSLLHHGRFSPHETSAHDPLMNLASRVPLPPSPAIKALAAEPSLTPAAVAAARLQSSRSQSDSSVLLSSAFQKSQSTCSPNKDAKASLAKALGCHRRRPTQILSDISFEYKDSRYCRTVSAPSLQGKCRETSHGMLHNWHERLKGMVNGRGVQNHGKGAQYSSEEDSADVSVGLSGRDSIASSLDSRAPESRPESGQNARSAVTIGTGTSQFTGGYPLGGTTYPSSEDLSTAPSRQTPDSSSSRSRSRGRDRRRITTMTSAVGPGAASASVLPEGRGRSRLRITAAVRSPSPHGRSRSVHRDRSLVRLQLKQHELQPSFAEFSSEEEAMLSEEEGDEDEDEGGGKGDRQGRTRSRCDRASSKKA